MNLSDLLLSYNAINTYIPQLEEIQAYDSPNFNLPELKIKAKKSIQAEEEIPQDYNINWTHSEPKNTETSLSKSNSVYANARIKATLHKNADAFALFNAAFDSYLLKHPEDNDLEMRQILTNIAAHESGYKSTAQNPKSTAFGYFQMIDSTRKSYSKMSKDQFGNSPEELIAAAIRMYKKIDNTYIKNNKDRLDARGIDKAKAMYGYWFRPASVLLYLSSGSDAYKDPQGTNLTKVWATYQKLGGILKKH